ncbi:hypothetical protein EU534_02080, partial [Candidatus Heimdallarchaeota archaeon]
PRFTVYNFPDGNLLFMFFNLRRPFIGGENNDIFLDMPGYENYTKGVAVRKAICYAINRPEINQIIYYGECAISHSIVYPTNTFYYYDNIVKYPYDMNASATWLGYAGYPAPEFPRDSDIIEDTPMLWSSIFASLGLIVILNYKRKKKE